MTMIFLPLPLERPQSPDGEREREQDENRKLDRVNKRRVLKGKEPLSKGDDVPREDLRADPVLDETQLILADFIAVSNPQRHLEITKAQTEAQEHDKQQMEAASNTKIGIKE